MMMVGEMNMGNETKAAGTEMDSKGNPKVGTEGFTTSLALVDALPVIFFGVAAIILGGKLGSGLFAVGAIICLAAGTGKVLWKLLIALWGKDVKILGAQLRFLMPAGFLLMIIGAVLADRGTVSALLQSAIRMPSVLFFVLAVCGMCGMIACSRHFDRRDARGNWIEQIINACTQGCVLVGILLL